MSTADTIRVMLQSVRDERAALKARDETLEQREATLLTWLKEERPTQTDLPINGELSDLGKFLLVTIIPGKKYVAADLGAQAYKQGHIATDVASPGRAVHGALLALQRAGYVKRNDDETWSRQ